MKKIIYNLALFAWIFVLGILLNSQHLHAQNQPNLLDLRTCGLSCSSNNYSVEEVFLSDINGNPITNSFATCTIGQQQTAYISFKYSTNSGSSTSNGRLFADLSIGNDAIFLNYFFGNLAAAKNNPVTITLTELPINWVCGQEVRLINPVLAWTTSGSANLSQSYDCNSYPSAQCQFNNDILVDAPLAVQFDYTACTVAGSTTVNFLNTSTGGRLPYTYSWNFGPNATPANSNQANPVVVYTGSGSATLTVTDAVGVSNTFTQSIVIPDEILVTPTVSQPTPGNSDGSISLVIVGGTGTISITWNDGVTGSSRNNLSPGTYQATITDENGCTKIETYVLIAPVPNISLVKTGVYVDTNGDGLQNLGDIINYTFLITNTGNANLVNVTLSDPGINLTGSPFSLNEGDWDNTTFSGTYTITQADIETGSFSNTATVTATAGSLTVEDESTFVVNFTQVPRIIVEKNQIGGPNPVTAAGQVIEYEITVENTGNLNISNLIATDFLPGSDTGVILTLLAGDDNSDGILNPGEFWEYEISYTVTQADIDLGDNLVNVVSVSSPQLANPVGSNAVTTVSQVEEIEIEKTASKTTDVQAGDEITYSYLVTNTGNITLNSININDVHPGTGTLSTPSTQDPIDNLAPGTSITFTATYTVTQQDIDNNVAITNEATVSGTAANGVPVSAIDTETITPEDAVPGIEILKTGTFEDVNGNGRADAGEFINYTFTVENTGNVTLTGVVVTDPQATVSGTPIAVMAPGAVDNSTF
ncbi:hypothetical protein ACFSKV_16390, partial [Shivajiella indica]